MSAYNLYYIDNNWNYKKLITLSPATSVANYQVKVELTPSNFDYWKAKSNGDDLRFYDTNDVSLNYWIEQWDPIATSIIWVKVPTSGTSTIYMYYGNPSASSASNGTNTFEFFDDFNETILDTTKWTNYQGNGFTIANIDQELKISGTAIANGGWFDNYIKSVSIFNGDYIIESKVKVVTLGGTGMGVYLSLFKNTLNYQIISQRSWTSPLFNDLVHQDQSNEGADLQQSLDTTDIDFAYHLMKMDIVRSSGVSKFYRDGTYYGTSTNTGLSTGDIYVAIGLIQRLGAETSDVRIDDFRVRKYVSSESIATIGNEINDIISYVGDFKLERELEKLLDKLTLKVSRNINNLAIFDGFNPNIELLLTFNNIGIFRGRIKTSNVKEYYNIEVYSSAEILDRLVAQRIYENTTPEAIFTDLINTYTDLTPNVAISGVTIEHFVADDYISSIVKKLNNALGWSIYTDSSKNIYFRPRGDEENSIIIRRQVSSSNAIFGQWKSDHNELCNDVRVTGSNVNFTTSQTFTGNGVTDTYYINEQPISIKISINTVEQNINTYTVFSESKKIVFETPPANGVTILIDYVYLYPLYAVRTDETSITTYGRFTKIFFHEWLTNRSDIITFCNNYIDTYKDPLLSNNILMNASYITTFMPGEQVKIIDDLEGYNDYYIINKIKLEYLRGIIELNIGSYIPMFITFQSSMQDRIKELEKNLSKSISYSHAFGINILTTPIMTLVGIVGASANIPITPIIAARTEQNTGTFLVGTARVGFSDVG